MQRSHVVKEGRKIQRRRNNGGDLGYFNAFQMVYPFEENAYSHEVGQVSDPFRTRFGFHILQVTDKRPARGTIQTAHLMIAVDKNANAEQVEAAEKRINEIYELLQKSGRRLGQNGRKAFRRSIIEPKRRSSSCLWNWSVNAHGS